MASRLLGKKLGKVMTYVLWFFAFYMAWKLVPAGYGKWINPEGPAWFLKTFGYGSGLFWTVSAIEGLFPFALFFHKVSFYAAIPIAVVMAVASFESAWDLNPITLTFLALLIAFLTRPEFLRKQAKITKITI